VSALWEEWVRDCPLAYTSTNAPRKEEIPGTILPSVLAGHKRYSHITSMRQDPVLPQWLGLACLRSEDSIRRAFAHVDGDAATLWLDLHLNRTYEPLLGTGWILDLDATVKPLYGEREEARLGYNPHKPGRPSHVYQACLCSAAKLVLNVDVQAGNQTASEYAQPVLWQAVAAARRSGAWFGEHDEGSRSPQSALSVQVEAFAGRLEADCGTRGPGRGLARCGRTLAGHREQHPLARLEQAPPRDRAAAEGRNSAGAVRRSGAGQ
jgi:hypothetical protein